MLHTWLVILYFINENFHFSFSREKSSEKTTATTAPTTTFRVILTSSLRRKNAEFFLRSKFQESLCHTTEREAESNVPFIFEISFFGELKLCCHNCVNFIKVLMCNFCTRKCSGTQLLFHQHIYAELHSLLLA